MNALYIILVQIQRSEEGNTKLYIQEMSCMYSSHKAIVSRRITQSFIYKKSLVYDPAQTDCVGKKSQISFIF